jgi:hypothetical protein
MRRGIYKHGFYPCCKKRLLAEVTEHDIRALREKIKSGMRCLPHCMCGCDQGEICGCSSQGTHGGESRGESCLRQLRRPGRVTARPQGSANYLVVTQACPSNCRSPTADSSDPADACHPSDGSPSFVPGFCFRAAARSLTLSASHAWISDSIHATDRFVMRTV